MLTMDEAGPSGISRRSLMLGSSALLAMVASPALIGRAEAQPVAALRSGELLTPPSFAGRIGNFAGVRPYRTGGVRIEAVPIGGNRFIIHNYGHGGAGITLSWGTARAVVGREVQQAIHFNQLGRIACQSERIDIDHAGIAAQQPAVFQRLESQPPPVDMPLARGTIRFAPIAVVADHAENLPKTRFLGISRPHDAPT